MQKIDLTGDQYRDFPKRKTGTVTVRNVASFERYYAKHADEDSEVFADLDAGHRDRCPGRAPRPTPRTAWPPAGSSTA